MSDLAEDEALELALAEAKADREALQKKKNRAALERLDILMADDKVTCPNGHLLSATVVGILFSEGATCNKCLRSASFHDIVARCDPCKIKLCPDCASSFESDGVCKPCC